MGGAEREQAIAPPPLPLSLAALAEHAEWARDLVGEAGAAVYRLHGGGRPALYLKHGTGAAADDVVDEMVRLRWLAGRIAVPAVRQFVLADAEAWLLTDAVPGRTAYQVLEDPPDDRGAIVDALAAFLRAFHALPVAACPFNADHRLRMVLAEQRLRAGAVDTEDFGDAHAGWSADRLWAHLADLIPEAPDRVVTHGDFSLDNILVADRRVVGCIDVGRAGVADRYQDLAILGDCLGEFDSSLQDRMFAAYGIVAPDRRRLDFHLALDEFF